jgi:tRNA A-37 threonylcarbamoyl transferase component Bud32
MISFTELNISNLKKIAKKAGIKGYSKYKKETKDQLLTIIKTTLKEEEKLEEIVKELEKETPKKEKKEASRAATKGDKIAIIDEPVGQWTKLMQVGKTGKDGRVYLVVNDIGESYVMKMFRKNKNASAIQKEVDFQMRAEGISPKIIEYNVNEKYIVMEKLDKTLIDILEKQEGSLTLDQQKSIIKLYDSLDKLNIFHNDANPLNIMIKGDKFYMIDYGFACSCDHKDIKGINHPNVQFMTVGLLSFFMKKGFKVENFEYLLKFVPKKVKEKILASNIKKE